MTNNTRRKFLKTSALGLGVMALGSSVFGKELVKKGVKMKIAVLAATGKAGRLITLEALNSGHSVTAFVRSADKAKDLADKGAKVVQKDIFALKSSDLAGFDVVISAFGEWKDLSLYKKHGVHLAQILAGNKARLLVVGGAGSYYMDKSHTTRLMDTPTFPQAHKGVAKAHSELLELLRKSNKLHWVYVSPPAEFVADAPKSGKYKIIGEEFEVNAKGESKCSYADYASAMIDIAEDSTRNKVRVGVIGL
ncbi:NAD(P)-dependent oxidoreductase [Helicobacter sp. T3_23-1059]